MSCPSDYEGAIFNVIDRTLEQEIWGIIKRKIGGNAPPMVQRSLLTSPKRPAKPKCEPIHRLSRHSFTTRVFPPWEDPIRVRATTYKSCLERARFVYRNYGRFAAIRKGTP